MSGGKFDYKQYHIRDIADDIEEYVYGHELEEDDVEYLCNNRWIEDEEKAYLKEHKHTVPNRYEFSEETIDKFKEAIKILRTAEIYAQRVDWLLSWDDGEDSFHERLKEDLEKLENKSDIYE